MGISRYLNIAAYGITKTIHSVDSTDTNSCKVSVILNCIVTESLKHKVKSHYQTDRVEDVLR